MAALLGGTLTVIGPPPGANRDFPDRPHDTGRFPAPGRPGGQSSRMAEGFSQGRVQLSAVITAGPGLSLLRGQSRPPLSGFEADELIAATFHRNCPCDLRVLFGRRGTGQRARARRGRSRWGSVITRRSSPLLVGLALLALIPVGVRPLARVARIAPLMPTAQSDDANNHISLGGDNHAGSQDHLSRPFRCIARGAARPSGRARFGHRAVAHCFNLLERHCRRTPHCRRLAALGIAVLRFDFTGLGHSEGEFGNNRVFLEGRRYRGGGPRGSPSEGMAPQLLIAIRLAVRRGPIAAAPKLPDLKGARDHRRARRSPLMCCTISAVRLAAGHGKTAAPRWRLRPPYRNPPATSSRNVRRRAGSMQPLAEAAYSAAGNACPRAIIVVGIGMRPSSSPAARHPKGFITLDDADQLLSRRSRDAEYAADVIFRLVGPLSRSPPWEASADNASGGRGAGGRGPIWQGFVRMLTVNGATNRSPTSRDAVGSSDTRAEPYQLLSAGLGRLHHHDHPHVCAPQEDRARHMSPVT